MPNNNSIVYSIFRPWVKLTAKFFFTKIELANAENIPLDKPVILVSNHQNAMLDPVMLCWLVDKQLHWLTRADLFKNPKVNTLLRSINMLPVYRERDNVDDLKGVNSVTFEECNRRLKMHQLLCVFPEGAHRGKKQLIPLKKGVARIAMNAIAGGLEDILIIPVGLNYESYYNYRTSLLATVGKPIAVKALTDTFDNPAQAQNALLQAIRISLKEVMIDIEDNDLYETIYELEPLCNKISGSIAQPIQFAYYHKTVKALNQDKNAREALNQLALPYHQLSKALDLEEKWYNENGFELTKGFMLVLGFLPSIAAILFFSPIYYLVAFIVKKIVKDPLFQNSIRLSAWMVLTPFYLIFSFLILLTLYGSFALSLTTTISLIFCGIIALEWRPVFKQYLHYRICLQYEKVKNQDYFKWLDVRRDLKNWTIQLNSKK